VRVLRHLEQRGCTFVPRLLEVDPVQLKIVTTNCGTRVDQLNEQRQEGAVRTSSSNMECGTRTGKMRNITYRASDGRFCVI